MLYVSKLLCCTFKVVGKEFDAINNEQKTVFLTKCMYSVWMVKLKYIGTFLYWLFAEKIMIHCISFLSKCWIYNFIVYTCLKWKSNLCDKTVLLHCLLFFGSQNIYSLLQMYPYKMWITYYMLILQLFMITWKIYQILGSANFVF